MTKRNFNSKPGRRFALEMCRTLAICAAGVAIAGVLYASTPLIILGVLCFISTFILILVLWDDRVICWCVDMHQEHPKKYEFCRLFNDYFDYQFPYEQRYYGRLNNGHISANDKGETPEVSFEKAIEILNKLNANEKSNH